MAMTMIPYCTLDSDNRNNRIREDNFADAMDRATKDCSASAQLDNIGHEDEVAAIDVASLDCNGGKCWQFCPSSTPTTWLRDGGAFAFERV
ncbi:hypothetical protein DERF_002660 [Dermatophagoides farinae]|uniref:Uncharacterized protein n=1 Tax=Dermatophagoides farinae TaxID=6954 RepID=A0A922LAU3_DERFA|nr:hypothetical protein DERF_002660 [Dermatophagoides farinae]